MKRLSWLLVCLLVLSTICAAPAAAAAEFELQTDAGGTVVTGWSGTIPSVLEIPAGVVEIREDAFSHCTDLTELVLPAGLTTIERAAFFGCTNLAKISWPDTLKTIGNAAFYNAAITELTLPASVETLSYGAFSGCTKLVSLQLPAGLDTVGTNTFRGCSSLRQVQLPEGIRCLGASCFADCSALEELQLPRTLQTLQDATFKGCTHLKSLDIPEGPTYLNYTFDECSALQSVTIPRSVTQILGNVFRKCSALQTIRYGGTQQEWEEALSHGNTTYRSDVTLIFDTPSAPTNPPTTAPSPGDPSAVYPVLRPESGLAIIAERYGSVLHGIKIGRGTSFTSVADVAAAFEIPAGTGLEITAGDMACDPGSPIATGDLVVLRGTDSGVQEVTVVVPGDVLGTGLLDVSQLVRMARAINGSVPLEGPFLQAACLKGRDTVSIADLVLLAQMLAS